MNKQLEEMALLYEEEWTISNMKMRDRALTEEEVAEEYRKDWE